jgi:hypothetical protein
LHVDLLKNDKIKNYHLDCALKSVRQKYTFSKYQVRLFLDGNYSRPEGLGQPLPAVRNATFDFEDIPSAEEFSFDGGTWPQKMDNIETTRVLSPNERLLVRWTDTAEEQYKEVLLIVIGTLIAFGVGTFIEWIRPHVDD